MAVDPRFVGRTYGPFRYEVGLEKLREFAYAIAGGRPNVGVAEVPEGLLPSLHDPNAPGGVVAFPTFAVNFAMVPFGAALKDPEVKMDLLRLVHGEQEFEFGEVVRPGDVITTTGTITKIFQKAKMDFVTVETESKNQAGKLVVRGTWTAVIRPA
jgi:hypothetical protein